MRTMRDQQSVESVSHARRPCLAPRAWNRASILFFALAGGARTYYFVYVYQVPGYTDSTAPLMRVTHKQVKVLLLPPGIRVCILTRNGAAAPPESTHKKWYCCCGTRTAVLLLLFIYTNASLRGRLPPPATLAHKEE